MKSSAIPKTIQNWIDKHPELIDEFWIEQDGYGEHHQGDWSIWLYLKRGYRNWMHEVHIIHEATVKNFIEETGYIEKCDCADCKE